MKQLNLAAIAALLFLVTSCHKTDAPPKPRPRPVPEKPAVLTKIARDSFLNSTYGYNEQGQLTDLVLTSYGQSRGSKFLYNGTGQMTGVKTNDYRTANVYTGNKLIRIDLINSHIDPNNNEPESFVEVDYTGDNITETRQCAIRGGIKETYNKTTYDFYPDGDLKKYAFWYYRKEEQRYVMEIAEEFEYDIKQSPWPKESLAFPWLYSPYNELNDLLPASHNIVKQTSYYESDQPTVIRTTSYTYSSKGYPLTAIVTWDFTDSRDDNIVDNITYSYAP